MKYWIILLICFFSTYVQSQDRTRVSAEYFYSQQGGFFNYGDKDRVNIEVSVWGYVKYPGKYIVPKETNIQDLISYAGGPLVEANLEEIRLYRPKNDSIKNFNDKIFTLNYNDLFWSEKPESNNKKNPVLMPGDILVFPGSPRYFFRDNLSFVLSILSVATSLAILVVSIVRK